MATFKDLKERLSNTTKNEKVKTEQLPLKEKIENLKYPELEIEEVRYMLSLIANSDFSGKDIQMVYNIALKLQNTMTYCLNKEDNG